jgi:hypothetical protein
VHAHRRQRLLESSGNLAYLPGAQMQIPAAEAEPSFDPFAVFQASDLPHRPARHSLALVAPRKQKHEQAIAYFISPSFYLVNTWLTSPRAPIIRSPALFDCHFRESEREQERAGCGDCEMQQVS